MSTPEVIDFPGFPTAVVRGRGVAFADLPALMDRAFTALSAAIGSGEVVPAGPAFCRYDTALVPDEEGTLPPLDLEAGFPLATALTGPIAVPAEAEEDGEIGIEPSSLPSCRLAITKHHGSYDGLGEAWDGFMRWIGEQGYTPGLPFWEAYDTEPTPEMDPAELITGLAVPVTRG